MPEKVVVITGASAGIGEALAVELASRGNLLVLAARREDELRRVAAALPVRTVTVAADVTRRAEVERIRDEAIAAFGRVDVWVNNVGRGITRPALELDDDDIDAMITVNVKSALYGMQAIAPHFMARNAGHIINVSSFLGRVPVASVRSVYSASKAALNSLTANVRMDLRASYPGIHVSTVMPGVVTTDFAKNALGGAGPRLPPAGASSPFQPQQAVDVARAIASLIDAPSAELYTNPAHAAFARRYFESPDETEEKIIAMARGPKTD